jgi:hypothetical protein
MSIKYSSNIIEIILVLLIIVTFSLYIYSGLYYYILSFQLMRSLLSNYWYFVPPWKLSVILLSFGNILHQM